MRTRRPRGAFTLLEILLVVAILVMLAALIVPQLGGVQAGADKDMTELKLRKIESALGRYKLENKVYPSTDQGLKALLEQPTEDPVPTNWRGPYVNAGDLVDSWNREFQYTSPGENNTTTYDLSSKGPNEEDEEDDIKNWKAEGEEEEGPGESTSTDTGGGAGE